MVARPAPVLTSPEIPLLFEPVDVRPEVSVRGWKRHDDGTIERSPDLDRLGAEIQRVMLRRVLFEERKEPLAAEIGYSWRQVGGMLAGVVHPEYGQPVIDWLHSVGIRTTKHETRASRAHRLVVAYRTVFAAFVSARHDGDLEGMRAAERSIFLLSGAWLEDGR
jgi:hypothetical protein